jgi:hypothetical protein
MTTEAWLFLSLVYVTMYGEWFLYRRQKKNLDKVIEDTLRDKAKRLTLISTPSLNKSEVRHIFEWDEPHEAQPS